MAQPDFVHLRLHSAYSLSEGAVRIGELAELCREHAMPAVAITDSNNLFGAMEFSGAMAGAGVQPIVGCQLAVRLGDADDMANGSGQSGVRRSGTAELTGPVVLLVKDETGYANLLKLISKAYLGTDDAHDPHIELADLEQNGSGLIALTGGPHGPLGVLLRRGLRAEAEQVLASLMRAFPDCLYMEIQRHGTDPERETEGAFLDWAYAHGVPLVATNEVFFPTRDMFEAHDALVCIAGGCRMADTERRRLTPEHYFKSADEMRALFEDLPEAVDNTVVVARRCAYMIEKVPPILPPYDCGAGRTEEEELRAQARAGLEARLAEHVWTADMDEVARERAARPYRERLEHELGIIAGMGFPGYFLIVADFIQWAKDHEIPVGPGRGSGAGSVVAWALTITDLDPLRWGLLFERFLNPERVSMPDFDVDFCQERRDEVIRYVQQKYGRDHVAQIITFGKLQARAVLRDVGRVLDMPYGYVDKICKLVPNNPANPVTLDQAIDGEPDLQRMIAEDPEVDRLFGIARKLEGLYRHASTHAAGVVIGDRPLEQLIPLYRDPRSNMPVTGFNMKWVESAGLVKFDFLGLKTLTVLAKAQELVRERVPDFDVQRIPLSDPETYAMIGRGETTGVFQLESAGMRDVLRGLKPDTFADIIAVVALYRPGPMDNIPSYVRRKHGEEDIDYLYPTLEGILKETYGIIIYQEQVMQIAQELAGYSLGEADLLRRAMGKKIKAEMDQQRSVFVEGAVARGVPERRATEIFDLVDKFAGYGFNKSHAAAYALVAYQTAYMKANYPVEFLAASMTLDLHNTDKLNVFRQELERLDIELLQPDVNASGAEFAVDRTVGENGAIRYALAAIKNVGENAMRALVAERTENGPYAGLADFVSRLDPGYMNKRQMENLVRAGALDSFNPNRRQLFEAIDSIMRHANAARAERSDDQMGLFAAEDAPAPRIELNNVADWPPMERLKEEFDAVGFYLSAHPLDAFGKVLEKLRVKMIANVSAERRDGVVTMAGTVIGKKERTSAKGTRYAFVQLSDPTGIYEVTVFSEVLHAAREFLEVGQSVCLKVGVQFEGETARLTAQSMEPVERRAASAPCGMRVVVDSAPPLEPLSEILNREGRGRGEVQLVTRLPEEDVVITLDQHYAVTPDVLLAVRSLPGILEVHEI